MGLFTKIEELSERIIEGFFKTKFSGDIQPVEIAKRIAREMNDKKAISVSKVYVPNEYRVFLHHDDMEKIKAVGTNLSAELRDYLLERARNKNFTLTHDPVVIFLEDTGVRKGSFRVAGKFTVKPGQEGDPEPSKEDILLAPQEAPGLGLAQEDGFIEGKESTQIFKSFPVTTKVYPTLNNKRVELVVIFGEDQGMAFLLNKDKKIIGRRPTNDIFINDGNVSREHAQIENKDENFIITDLDSTNGTFVNGNRISTHILELNDRIKVGTTILEYRVVQ